MIEVHFTEEERDDIDNPPKKDTYTVKVSGNVKEGDTLDIAISSK